MTDPTPSFEERVTRAFAADLAGNPDATQQLTYRADDSAYTSGELGIYIDVWPQTPGGSVTVADYTVSDDPSLSDSVIGMQVTIRHADLMVVKRITSDIFNRWHGRQRSMLGDVTVVSAMRTSGTNAGQDSNERQGRIENYYLTVHRPSTNRT